MFSGFIGDYLRAISDQWLKIAPLANPAVLGMFQDRDRKPPGPMVPWAGEFAGKFLTGAVQVYRPTRGPDLRRVIEGLVAQLVSLQHTDGYLEPSTKDCHLTGRGRSVGEMHEDATWDASGRYHLMLGLLLCHEETGDRTAIAWARRIGDVFCDKFSAARARVSSTLDRPR